MKYTKTKVFMLVLVLLLLSACDEIQPNTLILKTDTNTINNITNNITVSGANITNNITNNYTLANTSFACNDANDYIWNYSIINGVATGLCAADSTGSGADGTGGWVNTSTMTSTSLTVNVSQTVIAYNISFQNTSGTVLNSLYMNPTGSAINVLGQLYANTILSSGTQLFTDGDIFTRGAGGDLWLGASSQTNANITLTPSSIQLRGSAGGINTTYLTVQNLNAGASCDLKAHTNGTVYCGTDSSGSINNYSILLDSQYNITNQIWINRTEALTISNNLQLNISSVNSSVNARIDSLNITKLNNTDQRYNDTTYINTIANNLQLNITAINLTSILTTIANNLQLNITAVNLTTILNSIANNLQSNITSVNSTVTAQTTQINNLYTNITSINSSNTARIDNLNNTKLNATDQRYNETTYINTISTNLQSNISAVNTTLTAQSTQINNLYSNITSINSSVNARIDNLNTTKLNIADAITTYVNRSLWTTIDNYPTACSGTEAVRGIADTLTCFTLTNSHQLSFLNITGLFSNSQVGIASINNNSLNVTNQGTSGQLLSYGNNGQFTWTTAGAATGDGTGGWLNDTTQTNTSLMVNIRENVLNISDAGQANLYMQGTSTRLYLRETDVSAIWTYLLSGGDIYYKKESGTTGTFNIRASDNIDRLIVNLGTNMVTINNSLRVANLTAASCDVKADTTGNLYCGTDATGAGGESSWVQADEFNRKIYKIEAGFESVTAAYNDPWIGTAIGAGTTALVVGSYNHPGTASISTSATASSGYSYQITGATTYLLGANYTTQASIKPIAKTGNVAIMKFGFMDVFTGVGAVVDGVYFNISQVNATTFSVRGVSVTNSVMTTTPNYNITQNLWYGFEIYIVNTTYSRFNIYNETHLLQMLNITTVTIPSVAGRETSHAFLGYTNGTTTAQVMANIDYMSVGINGTINR